MPTARVGWLPGAAGGVAGRIGPGRPGVPRTGEACWVGAAVPAGGLAGPGAGVPAGGLGGVWFEAAWLGAGWFGGGWFGVACLGGAAAGWGCCCGRGGWACWGRAAAPWFAAGSLACRGRWPASGSLPVGQLG